MRPYWMEDQDVGEVLQRKEVIYAGLAVMQNAGDSGSLNFTEGPAPPAGNNHNIGYQITLFGSPAILSSHANPSEGQSAGVTALKQERMCSNPPEFDLCFFYSVQGLSTIKMQKKKKKRF